MTQYYTLEGIAPFAGEEDRLENVRFLKEVRTAIVKSGTIRIKRKVRNYVVLTKYIHEAKKK
jgi:hypothetical protein